MGGRSRIKFKVMFIAIGVIVSLELLLHVVGLTFFYRDKVSYHPDDAGKIRILALGESTTDSAFAEGRAWPDQLQEKLIAKGFGVKVYNMGKATINSAMILSSVSQQLEIFNPHIVVSMMGINDIEAMTFDYTETSSRLLKFFFILKERLTSALSCKLNAYSPSELDVSSNEIDAWAGRGPQHIVDIEREVRKKTGEDKHVASAMALIAYSANKQSIPYVPSKSEAFYRRAYELDPLSDLNSGLFLNHLNNNYDSDCVEVSAKVLSCASNLSDQVLTKVFECYQHQNIVFSHGSMNNRGMNVHSGHSKQSTLSKHYQMLEELSRKAGSQLVAVQYPTLKIDGLKEHFPNAESKVIFVGNEENFRTALAAVPYEKLFVDRFRGSWGHTTEKGHELIAREVAEKIEPLLRK